MNRRLQHEIDRRDTHDNRIVGACGPVSEQFALYGRSCENGVGHQARLSRALGLTRAARAGTPRRCLYSETYVKPACRADAGSAEPWLAASSAP